MSIPASPQRFPSPDDQNDSSSASVAQNASIDNINTVNTSESPLATSDITGAVNNSSASIAVGPVATTAAPIAVVGRWRDVGRFLTHNPKVLTGLIIIFLFLLLALFGPMFIHKNPNAFSNATYQAPSAQHWLGTTESGQDIFSQLVVGARPSILWGFLTAIVVTILSIIIGMVSGYFGGVIDDAFSLLINIFLVIPSLPLNIVLAAYVPFKGDATISIVIAITGWAWGARVLRSQTLSMRGRDFVEAARASGEKTLRIVFFEILPNEIGIVAAGFVGTFIYVIGATVTLEYLGLGDTTQVSWGNMFYWAQNGDALLQGAWWWFAAPGLCVAILCTALTLINFGIDEIANPRLRREPKLKLKKQKAVA